MTNAFIRLFAPPVFQGEEEKTRLASLLNEVILMSLVFTTLVIIAVLLGNTAPASSLFIAVLWLLVLTVSWRALRGGRTTLVALSLTILFFAFLTMANISLGTIRTPTAAFYVFWVILVGMVFKLPGILMATCASSLAVLGMILAENAKLLPLPNYSVGVTQWMNYTVLFSITASMVFYSNRMTQKALMRAENEIEQRKVTEMELHKLTRAVEQSPASIVITDLNGKIEYVNPRFSRVTGYQWMEVVGQNPRLLKSGQTPPETHRQLWNAVTAGHEWHGEFVNQKKDGSLYYESAIISPIADTNGVATHYLAVKEDITERKRAEEALRISEERHRILADYAKDVIWTTALDGSITYISPAVEAVRGFTAAETMRQKIEDILTPASQSIILGYFKKLSADLAAGRTAQSFQQELEYHCKDGSTVWTEVTAHPVLHEDGSLAEILGVTRDIGEHKRLVLDLQRLKEAAEAANLAKSQFLASMSHEIRTPMNGILGMAQVLMLPDIEETDRLEYTRIILTSGQTLLNLLNDILDLSKIEAGKVNLESIAFEPYEILRETELLFTEMARTKGLPIEVHWSGPVRRYLGDPLRLRQMLSNLLGNALKFTQNGHIYLAAQEVEIEQESALLEFSVSDSGIGIAEDKQSLLFQNFSQVDSSTTRNYGGTGLGLSIVRTLAELMGGKVGVESKPDLGSRFWFRIRAQRLEDLFHTSATLPGAAVGKAQGPATFAARLLVVEDNLVNQTVIGVLLEKLGVTALFAADGKLALAMITAGEPVDLILMDLEMPVLDGYQATLQIRQREAATGLAHLPIIALTASAFAEDRQRCLEAGMDDVLTKPIALNILTATLQQWLPEAMSTVASNRSPI